jgi:hypothetical protein
MGEKDMTTNEKLEEFKVQLFIYNEQTQYLPELVQLPPCNLQVTRVWQASLDENHLVMMMKDTPTISTLLNC